jgi:GNAT superfamily N-acetyltransferase
MDFEIKPLEFRHSGEWLELWKAYVSSENEVLSEEITAKTWERLTDNTSNIYGLGLTINRDTLIGFCHYVLQDTTWDFRPVCYLQDIFIQENFRRKGLGKVLIQRALIEVQSLNCASFFLMVKGMNEPARILYEQMARNSDYVRYDFF